MKRSALALGKTISLSVIALLSGISSFLGTMLSLPKLMGGEQNGMNASVYVLSDYLLLLGIISPIVKSDISVGDLLSQTEIEENAEYDALMHTANLTEKKIREEMKEVLINEGVNEYEIYVSTSVDAEENTVYLEEIKIEVGNTFENKINIIKSKVPEEYRQVLKVGVKNE